MRISSLSFSLLISRLLLISSIALFIASCVTPTPPEPQAPAAAPEPILSAEPLSNVSVKDIRFAQAALTQLGFKLGRVDGIWGARSSQAMIKFEELNSLESAGGAISELNLHTLSKTTKVKRSIVEGGVEPASSTNKLDASLSLDDGPQLVIVDKPYAMRSKANPYSELLGILQPGTGVYVVSKQGDWYQVESLEHVKGFIQEN